jgi:hypothetical protein
MKNKTLDTSKLRKFASFARSALIEQVGTRLKTVLAEKSLARRESPKVVEELEKKSKQLGQKRLVETVAYTWFNRFCALRYMDVNRYNRIGVLSPADGQFQPEILAEAKMGHIDEELVPEPTRKQVLRLLDGSDKSVDPQGEAYRLLLVAVCNYYHSLMPFMFEKIADYTELLLPDDLLSGTSIPAYTREALLPINCSPEHTEESVEVIGWLYQFYIADKKDEVFKGLKKGKKITAENIPAATQLFTPHWIVRYLVENSLGRLWMLNHPESKLVERMDYYIKPEESETDFLKFGNPEEIRVCDPACGSGHMLTYAFDLLYEIYREEQYPEPEIPSLILKNNLFGIEIDQRAGALAAFALTMKAREKDKRYFTRKTQSDASGRGNSRIQNPNICVLENIQIDPDDLSAYMDKVGCDLFSGGLQGVVNQWEEVDNLGSLIRPLVTDVRDVLELLRERQMGQDLFLADVHQKVLKALRQADYLCPKYHVVVANPPYMGSRNMNSNLKEYVFENFDETKADLFSAFIERNLDLAFSGGLVAMITMQSWMFLASYEELRSRLAMSNCILTMAHLGARAFDTIGGEVVSTTAFVIGKFQHRQFEGTYIRLVDGQNEAEKKEVLRIAVSETRNKLRYNIPPSIFESIPSMPIAYWASKELAETFHEFPALGKLLDTAQGMKTLDNQRFIREWHEVGFNRTSLLDRNSKNRKWFPINHGGDFRKWYGNRETVLNWENDGSEIKALAQEKYNSVTRTVTGMGHYFKPGFSWTAISTGSLGARFFEEGFLFTNAGMCAFGNEADLRVACCILNSRIAIQILEFLSPTVNFGPKQIDLVPVTSDDQVKAFCIKTAEAAEAISRNDWDGMESSWDFQKHRLIDGHDNLRSLELAVDKLLDSSRSNVERLRTIEKSLNVKLIEHYGLANQDWQDLKDEDITLFCNPVYRYGSDRSESERESLLLADTMRELISYSLGCMFGRYSLDKPGLILANQGQTANDYLRQIPEPTFAPDEDNVIPLLDRDWFEDDITERFKAFLKVTFGTEHYNENLTFLENALYPENVTGKKRKTIRYYFLNDFYNHHIKLYKKRPIYWLFSSPKGTFSALIYMHRYRPDTVGTVLQYLRGFRDKLMHHADHQQMLADSASASKSEKTQAIKDVAAIKKQLKELEDYEKTLFEVAARKIDIDLDDGVKHNYLLFGSVLRKIVGLDAKDD